MFGQHRMTTRPIGTVSDYMSDVRSVELNLRQSIEPKGCIAAFILTAPAGFAPKPELHFLGYIAD
jgi:hypothetical protein